MPTFSPATFWNDFRHGSARVNGVHLHYVEGGSGAPILLIPGWPQSWYAWRLVMPLLAASGRRVIAIDPRGMGDSDKPASGYDLKAIATDLHEFANALGLLKDGPLDVAGHDIGTWIGHAYAADWPEDIRRLALFDAALPGITPPPPAGIPSAEINLRTWHFPFNRLDDLPEILLQGHERAFLSYLFHTKAINRWAIAPADLDEYERVFSAPGAVRAALSYYRIAFSPEGLAQSRDRGEKKLPMPILAMGAEHGVKDALLDTLRSIGSDVQGGVLQGCGHYMPEEMPDAIADALLRFFKT
ncbi:alpha/beta hydrolase [Herbaspirillum hiltneri N3]|uniref:Alpha/beta hydrolase n=1 Tax=Herbaspirillum hiltneri N3 TaxID=1262470 RepID=A0ABM5UYA7_9BURK|nr:alpha/beta fold hydrolase [Herbaspirillum hiltneri]AKZ62138.1 alpha/beta hydrolase [Herbaspirillum hiltneri N3]